MPRYRAIIAAAVFVVAFVAVGQSQEKKIEVHLVKYDGLKQEVLKHRGKVVVLDFWATTCPPCMQHFPDVIKMQQKFANKGLVVISVSLDNAEKETVQRVNRFLTKQESPLRNLLLDEPPEVFDKKFEFKSLPFYYLFDRHGKWVRLRAADYQKIEQMYAKLDETVVKMLNDK